MNKRSELLKKMDELVELLGSDFIVENMALYMSTDDLDDCLQYIDRNCDTNVFYNGPWVSEVQDWMGKTLHTFEFDEHGEDCEYYAILKREEIASEQARNEWEENKEQCIKDGYNSVEELEDAILDDLYVVSYNKQGDSIPANFG